MVDIVEILVEELSVSTGTGDMTLSGKNARRTFNESYGTGGLDKFYYFIVHDGGDEWEHGTGHLSGPTTLVRDTVIKSSNANALVNFSVGTKDVVSDRPGNLPINIGEIRFNPEIFVDPGDFTAGSTTQLTLAQTPIQEGNVLIFFEGVLQHTNAYSLLGNVITFTTAIPVGTTQVEMRVVEGGGIFTIKEFFDIGITAGGSINIAHTMPNPPQFITTQLVNTTDEHGWIAGDVTDPSHFNTTIAGGGTGVALKNDGPSNVLGRFGSDANTFNVLDFSDGTEQQITNANWNLRINLWS